MYLLITIFYISLVGIAGMIVLKRHEVKSGRVTVVSRLGRGTDRLFGAAIASVGRNVSYFNRKTFIVIAQWVAYHILLRIRKIYVEIKHRALINPHSKKVLDAVRGRGEVRDHGASFYLRRIGETKK